VPAQPEPRRIVSPFTSARCEVELVYVGTVGALTTGDAVAWLPEQGVASFSGDLVFNGGTTVRVDGLGGRDPLDALALLRHSPLERSCPGTAPTVMRVRSKIDVWESYLLLVCKALPLGAKAAGLSPLEAAAGDGPRWSTPIGSTLSASWAICTAPTWRSRTTAPEDAPDAGAPRARRRGRT